MMMNMYNQINGDILVGTNYEEIRFRFRFGSSCTTCYLLNFRFCLDSTHLHSFGMFLNNQILSNF